MCHYELAEISLSMQSNNIYQKLMQHQTELRNASLSERLVLLSQLDQDFAITSAFGYSGVILLYHMHQASIHRPVYFIDTGFHFKETLKLVEQLTTRWNLNVVKLAPNNTPSMDDKPYEQDADLCCFRNKVTPLQNIIDKPSFWLHAIRRDQSPTRAKLDIITKRSDGIIKVHPMFDWDKEMCWNFIKKHNLPVNSLHSEGYFSIGCEPCTQKTQPGQHEREGRWTTMPKMECGLHLDPKANT